MDQYFYFIIVGAILAEYILSTLSSILNMHSIDEKVPEGFEDYYDKGIKKEESIEYFLNYLLNQSEKFTNDLNTNPIYFSGLESI